MQGQQNHTQNQIALNAFGSAVIDFRFERTVDQRRVKHQRRVKRTKIVVTVRFTIRVFLTFSDW